jgi:hypothetical protein
MVPSRLMSATFPTSKVLTTWVKNIRPATELYEGIGALSSKAYTDPTTLPTSGGATYDGLMSLEQIVGEMTMTTDFANDAISGSMTNFIDEDDSAISGTLTISSASDGGIDRTVDTATAYTFTAELTGELSDEDGAYTIVSVILGDFTGPDQEYVEGSVIGFAIYTVSDEEIDFSGHFGGEQQ